jgi:hypothetical protein
MWSGIYVSLCIKLMTAGATDSARESPWEDDHFEGISPSSAIHSSHVSMKLWVVEWPRVVPTPGAVAVTEFRVELKNLRPLPLSLFSRMYAQDYPFSFNLAPENPQAIDRSTGKPGVVEFPTPPNSCYIQLLIWSDRDRKPTYTLGGGSFRYINLDPAQSIEMSHRLTYEVGDRIAVQAVLLQRKSGLLLGHSNVVYVVANEPL